LFTYTDEVTVFVYGTCLVNSITY